jgi:hypothetical protein
MNIIRALEVALPELPERIIRNIPPKLDPKVISKEHFEKGQALVLVKMPGTELVFRFFRCNGNSFSCSMATVRLR